MDASSDPLENLTKAKQAQRIKYVLKKVRVELDQLAMNDEKKRVHELLISNKQREERQEHEAAKNI